MRRKTGNPFEKAIVNRIRARPLGLKLSRRQRDAVIGYLFMSPWLLGFLIFILGPFIASLVMSLTDWQILVGPEWLGLRNYQHILTRDEIFRKSLFNTAFYVVFHVPGVQIIALSLAVLLNQKLRGIAIYRTIFYLPSVTSGVATALLWVWLFNYRQGLINVTLKRIFGIEGPNWLYSFTWSMPALVIMSYWSVGTAMIIYLAGLQGVPTELYEAAEVDGAGRMAKFFHVTLPMITPAIFFNMIMGIIGSFQVFTAAYVMTGGGPGNATLFYVLYLYRVAFHRFQMGYASALAWILFVMILIFTLIQLALSRRWVFYQAAGKEVM